MFEQIPAAIQAEMNRLEKIDARDRQDGTPRQQRLRQIPPETGRFLAILAAASPPGPIVEIGTSAGYSTLWLALAARESGRMVTTFELLEEKHALAQQTFSTAGITPLVKSILGDARQHLDGYTQIGFCFLDAEKEVYEDCYELIVPRLAPGGLLIGDNFLSHRSDLQPLADRAAADPRLDALVVPVGKGLLLGRKTTP